eukprot:Nitzschia sp. Nitz4//scaffold206_size41850//5431//13286//NITZ4_007417-RA/size41850-processed-gene-0.40-mRNA-1//1//CDS//3329541550//8770//frame0
MEIYQEPILSERKVSFAAASNSVRTPLRRPLADHNNNNNNNNTPASARGMKKTKSGTPHTAKLGRAHSGTSTPKTPKTSFHDKENQQQLHPNSAQAFRRALRGKSPATETIGSCRKTPNSLLRKELDANMDESLLVSPPAQAFWSAVTASQSRTSPAHASSTSLIMLSPQAAQAARQLAAATPKAELEDIAAHSVQSKPGMSLQDIVSPPQPKTLDWKSPQARRPRLSPPRRLEVSSSPSEPTLEAVPTVSKKSGVAMDMTSMFSPPSNKPVPPAIARRLAAGSTTKSATKSSNTRTSSLQTKKLSPKEVGPPRRVLRTPPPAEEPPVEVQPESQGKGGVSMDLSNFFSGESTTLLTLPSSNLLKRLEQKSIRKPKPEEPAEHPSEQSQTSPLSMKSESKSTSSSALSSRLSSRMTKTSKSDALGKPARVTRSDLKADPKEKAKPTSVVTKDETTTSRPKTTSPPRQQTSKASRPTSHPLPVATKKVAPQSTSLSKPSSCKATSRPPKNVSPTRPSEHVKSISQKTMHTPNVAAGRPKVSTAKRPLANSLKGNKVATPKSVARSVTKANKNLRIQTNVSKSPSTKMPAHGPNDWAGKQCDTFVEWLNYAFHPSEDDDSDSTPTTPSSGLRLLVIHRRLAQVRFRAMELFHSETLRQVRNTIQSEIARGRLTIRSDRDICADLTLRQQATKLLLSYTTPWLRLGLEVMFGETIMPENLSGNNFHSEMTPVGRMRAALKEFVVDRVLSDQNVLLKYTRGKTKIPSGKFERLYREEMRTLVLYRLMVLILFLDHAKSANILDKVPRLFAKGSDVKSSKAVLLALCRGFLSAEGDFIKHMSRIGLTVQYVQDPIDELEFSVSNLAADLRDGARLVRVAEVIDESPFKSMMRSLRLPAVSRLQKIHNVNVAFTKFQECGIFLPSDLSAHHIVDAHREMVLKLMWAVISHTCLAKLLEGDHVKQEIQNVLKSNVARNKVLGRHVQEPMVLALEDADQSNQSPEVQLKALLLQWCQAVCSNYEMKLEDFSTSFADGRALCYLVHHYHPSLIPVSDILPTSGTDAESLSPEQALHNERANSSMVSHRVKDLGGIPNMLPISDSKNPPDERSMLLCLSYMCSRLMESSKEIFATILIQTCYRRYLAKVLQEKKEAAAWGIYTSWCHHKDNYYENRRKRYAAAVSIVEEFVICHKSSLVRMRRVRLKKEIELAAAILIQRHFRGFQGREKFYELMECKLSATIIQTYTRRFMAQLRVLEMLIRSDAAIKLQSHWRQCRASRQFETSRQAAIVVQAAARTYFVKRNLASQGNAALRIQEAWWNFVERIDRHTGATLIQTWWRGVLARNQLDELISRHYATITVQAAWRRYREVTMFEISKECAVLIQKVVRGHLERKYTSFRKSHWAAVQIQRMWRGFAAQIAVNLDLMDIVSVQSLARVKLAKQELYRRREAVTVIQSSARCALARWTLWTLIAERDWEQRQQVAATIIQCAIRKLQAKELLQDLQYRQHAAVLLQAQWQCFVIRSDYEMKKMAIVFLQGICRGYLVRKEVQRMTRAAFCIQKAWLQYRCDQDQQNSCVIIQKTWRGLIARRHFVDMKNSTIQIQSYMRMRMAMMAYRNQFISAIAIQTCWRRYSAMFNFELDILEVVLSQSVVRRKLAQITAQRRRNALHRLQNATRCWLASRRLAILRQTRDDYIEMTQATTKIQSIVRGFSARMTYHTMWCGILSSQAAVRGYCARRVFLQKKVLAGCLQALYRGHQARQALKHQHAAAVKIQSTWRAIVASYRYGAFVEDVVTAQSAVRGYLARKRSQQRMLALVTLQSAVRMWQGANLVQQLRLRMEQELLCHWAATTIQATYRGSIVRQHVHWMHFHATMIQAAYRSFNAQVAYHMDLFDIIMVQAKVRQKLALREALMRWDAILSIQHVARAWLARKQLLKRRIKQNTRMLENKAAIYIQAGMRGFLARLQVMTMHTAAIYIQASYRRWHDLCLYEMTVVDIVTVQSLARRWLVSRHMSVSKSAALSIQCFVRCTRARKEYLRLQWEQDLAYTQHMAAISIQSLWREYTSRKIVSRHIAARKIQKTWRCFSAHVEFLVQQIFVVRIQATARQCLARRALSRSRHGIIQFQALVRGALERDKYDLMWMSACIIQASFRSYVQRCSFLDMKEAAIKIQSVVRGNSAREDVELSHFAATEIQRTWRGFVAFCDYFIYLDAVVKMQSFFRRYIAMQRYREHQLRMYVEQSFFNARARTIQRAFRSYAEQRRLSGAATTIQLFVRSYQRRRRETRVDRGITRLQAVFRARMARRRRTKKVTAIAKRVVVANRKSRENPKLRIGYKTRHALKILQTSRSLAEIMDAVKSLETSTRLSPLCCVLFTEANAATILLDLIRSCNRSVPHVELVQCILLTLDNVAEHKNLVRSFADCSSAEIFLDKMQMFRDKDGIFCLSVHLLGCIAKDNPMVEEYCAMHEHLKRLKALHQLSLRRAKPNAPHKRPESRLTKRSHFDRNRSIRALGSLVSRFEQYVSVVSPSSRSMGAKHFSF